MAAARTRTIPIEAARAGARLAKVIEVALADATVSLPQYRVLAFLAGHDDVPAGALADRLAVTRPSVTALVDGLVARGYVERLPDGSDRRRVRHVLTAAGRTALDDADASVQGTLGRVLAHLDPPDVDAALAGLIACHEAIERAAVAVSSPAP